MPATPTLNASDLLAPFQRATGPKQARLRTWHVQPLHYDATNPVSAGVYRVSGTAEAAGHISPWSMILKIIRAPEETAPRPGYWPGAFLPVDRESSAPMYWRREVLAYQSRLLAELPPGITAPRCFGVDERHHDLYWLWLEDIHDAYDRGWTLDRYLQAARHLGRFNGGYLTGFLRPSARWLSRHWMRSWLDLLDANGGLEPAVSALSAVLSPAIAEGLRALWRERLVFLDALERLPPTLCHYDAHPANLLARSLTGSDGETVAIDWTFVGIGSIGEEIAPLILVPAPSGAEVLRLDELQERVLDSYIGGLHDAGWQGDSRLVRLGYAASAALRYGCLTAAVLLLHAADPHLRITQEERHGCSIRELLDEAQEKFSFFLRRADEARLLLGAA